MRRFYIIDKTRKDQYTMNPVVAIMKAYSWLQYKNHPVFYKKQEALVKTFYDEFNPRPNYTIMYPIVEELKCNLVEDSNNYYARLMMYYVVNHHKNKTHGEYPMWKRVNIYVEDNYLENVLNNITINLYKEGGCYTEAVKCCRNMEERTYHGLNHGSKYFKLTDFNRTFVKTLHVVNNLKLDLKWWVKDTKRNFYKSIITFLTMPLPEFFTRLFGMHSSQQQNEN